ncbi:MAG: EAL domain-containing protein [Pseudomonadales bacterium]|nr:EAL domain-containing protein [Pseudomonadales bacterium]
MTTNESRQKIRVLLVDDDPDVVRISKRLLSQHDDIEVEAVQEPAVALIKSRKFDFDVIVSDIVMPGMDGIELVRSLRGFSLDVPVILLTGSPKLETAQKAVELGAYRYLIKPVEAEDLIALVRKAAAGYRIARLKRQANELDGEPDQRPGDAAGLESALSSAIRSRWVAYQPIVKAVDGSVFGFEALLRSEEGRLATPGDIVDAATRLGQLQQLGRAIRDRTANDICRAPANSRLFVNVHPDDLMDLDLGHPNSRLTELSNRVILEVSEHFLIEPDPELEERLKYLKRKGFQFAIDDLGSGEAGLGGFKWLEPLIAKIDMDLTNDVDQDKRKQDIVASMIDVCHDNDIIVVAEGIETPGQMSACRKIGCDLLQGYHIAEPGRPFPAVSELAVA